MSQLLALLIGRLTKPALDGAKRELHRMIVALAFIAGGIASLVIGLSYFASSAWHALVPRLGSVGADLILGFVYLVISLGAITVGLQLTRR